MLKTDVPLRTGWFGYRKKDVEACIDHLCAVHAAENRLAREQKREMEGIMAQIRQENRVLRQRLAQQAAMQVTTLVDTDSTQEQREQIEQLNRKLAAARAEVRRYQTRLFACERQMFALRHENAELEAACERAREEAQQAQARAQRAEQALQETNLPAAPGVPEQKEPVKPPAQAAAVPAPEPVLQKSEPSPAPEPEPVPAAEAAPAVPKEPVWQPQTALERLSAELLNRFDQMMADCSAVEGLL